MSLCRRFLHREGWKPGGEFMSTPPGTYDMRFSGLMVRPLERAHKAKTEEDSHLGTAHSSPARGAELGPGTPLREGQLVRALIVGVRMVAMSDRVSVSSGENVVAVVPVSMPSP